MYTVDTVCIFEGPNYNERVLDPLDCYIQSTSICL